MISLSIILLALCALIALVAIGAGTFVVLLKLGVIVREASRPTYQDTRDFPLEQGREVRPEEERV